MTIAGMIGSDMAYFMAKHASHFGLVIGKRHELPRDVHITTRGGEGVVDRRIEQRNRERAFAAGKAGLHGNLATDIGDIASFIALGIQAAKLGDDFAIRLLALLPRLRGHRLDRDRIASRDRIAIAGAGARRKGKRGHAARQNSTIETHRYSSSDFVRGKRHGTQKRSLTVTGCACRSRPARSTLLSLWQGRKRGAL